jgi:radical SAM superfamily enzyme YgiQ (UPF0313 family)
LKKEIPKRLSRARQKKHIKSRGQKHPDIERKALLADETGTIFKTAPRTIGLCYPNPYHTAMSSLGYQVVYRMFNAYPLLAAERLVLPLDPDNYRQRGLQPLSIESGRPLGSFEILAFSVAYDPDITGFFELLDLGGIPIQRKDRRSTDPLVILGGPLTASNALPFSPFIDLAVIGDAEDALSRLIPLLAEATDRDALFQQAAEIPGIWIPEYHGEKIPPTQKVTVNALPAVGQIITPNTELSNMFLIEASRGCPRFCKFCLVRSPESPMRENNLEDILNAIPAHAPRVGFVGAAISEWTGIRPAIRAVVDRGMGVGISSLRADRLDTEFVNLLAAGGYRTMTVAADAASQRLRNKMAKGIRTRHLIKAAQLAAQAGMQKLKLYVVIGLPGEEEEDLAELVALTQELSRIIPVALGLSPLVPKLHTPLGDTPFAGIQAIDHTLKTLRKDLKGVAEMRSTSAKWAWIEYRLSQGDESAGLAALEAWRAGGRFSHWKQAFRDVEERGALNAARRVNLWQPAGMK